MKSLSSKRLLPRDRLLRDRLLRLQQAMTINRFPIRIIRHGNTIAPVGESFILTKPGYGLHRLRAQRKEAGGRLLHFDTAFG